jgi:hypothetical protein
MLQLHYLLSFSADSENQGFLWCQVSMLLFSHVKL